MKTTWRKLVAEAMNPPATAWRKGTGESWSDVEVKDLKDWKKVSCTLTDAELDSEFDDGYGGYEGQPFTLWTTKRVYFPAGYDGSEWVESVAREPDGAATGHVGGS